MNNINKNNNNDNEIASNKQKFLFRVAELILCFLCVLH